jgi:ribosome-binding protein aMBF1 (putative translation factor)
VCWHHGEVSNEVPEVLEARDAYKQADADARLLRARGRAKLGRSIDQANKQRGVSLEALAKELGVALNQVLRYRETYRNWDRDHPDVPIDG